MPKVKRPHEVAVEAARRVLRDAGVRGPRDIHAEALAVRHGAMVLYGPVSTARANIVRTGRRAVIRVDETARGTPRASLTICHELGHHLLHDVADHFEQCLGTEERRQGRAWRVEDEAYDFGRELLAPESWAKPYCGVAAPTLDDVERLARVFRLSNELSLIRYVQMANLHGIPCAAALTVDGAIKWAPETAAFPGKIVRWRHPHAASVAARIVAGGPMTGAPRAVPGEAWGAKVPLVEQAVRVGPRTVISWIAAKA